MCVLITVYKCGTQYSVEQGRIFWRSEVALCDFDEFITWALVIPEVADAPNEQSISGLIEKVPRYVQSRY